MLRASLHVECEGAESLPRNQTSVQPREGCKCCGGESAQINITHTRTHTEMIFIVRSRLRVTVICVFSWIITHYETLVYSKCNIKWHDDLWCCRVYLWGHRAKKKKSCTPLSPQFLTHLVGCVLVNNLFFCILTIHTQKKNIYMQFAPYKHNINNEALKTRF